LKGFTHGKAGGSKHDVAKRALPSSFRGRGLHF
jgi:hypothetical protein